MPPPRSRLDWSTTNGSTIRARPPLIECTGRHPAALPRAHGRTTPSKLSSLGLSPCNSSPRTATPPPSSPATPSPSFRNPLGGAIDVFDLAVSDGRRRRRLVLTGLGKRLFQLEGNFQVHRPGEIGQRPQGEVGFARKLPVDQRALGVELSSQALLGKSGLALALRKRP